MTSVLKFQVPVNLLSLVYLSCFSMLVDMLRKIDLKIQVFDVESFSQENCKLMSYKEFKNYQIPEQTPLVFGCTNTTGVWLCP